MRPEKLYPIDIREAVNSIEEFCKNIEYDQFRGDDLCRSAVLQKLIVIGEAANRMPEEFTNRHPEVP